MGRSDWQELSARALREGRSLRQAAVAYRAANAHVHRNPTSPESHHRRWRHTEVGGLLRAGVPFKEALRRIEGRNPWWSGEPEKGAEKPPIKCQACGRIFRRPEQLWKHQREEHGPRRRNPDGAELLERPWLVMAAIAGGAYLLWRGANARAQVAAATQAITVQGGQPLQGQLDTASPYGHQTGSFASSMDPTNAVPGGTMVNTTVNSPWDVGI